MTNDFNVTIRFDKSREDFDKLKRIMKEMDNYQTTTSDKDEATRQWKEEFRRRLVESGLSR